MWGALNDDQLLVDTNGQIPGISYRLERHPDPSLSGVSAGRCRLNSESAAEQRERVSLLHREYLREKGSDERPSVPVRNDLLEVRLAIFVSIEILQVNRRVGTQVRFAVTPGV